ncbi:MAG: hypothetical protein DRQ58_07430 [Gammaproteobacteria bacterium]|nr:MAG: hypothetical protein DRQ58_07430 [Gammaproteobacteria bacterium]
MTMKAMASWMNGMMNGLVAVLIAAGFGKSVTGGNPMKAKEGRIMNGKMSQWLFGCVACLSFALVAAGGVAFAVSKPAEMQSQLATLEMPFIENQGQTDDSVKFYAKTFGGTVFVTENGELIYTLPKSEAKQRQVGLPEVTSGLVLKEHLLNARHGQTIQGENKTTTQVNVFSGNDPTKWQRQLPTYSRVNLGQVYEGITLKLKAAGNNVEKLFYVTPQTNVEQIRMHIEGSQGLSVNDSQELVVATELGDVKFSAPIAFQEIDGKRVDVEVVYSVKEDNVYGFTVASYDNTHQLVIDPVLASTIIGGSNEDPPTDIALDANKNVYIVGITKSPIMPSSTNTYEGYNSGYIAKLTPELDEVVYFTYMGGNRWNGAEGVGIDDDGNVYITGVTFSSNFSTTTTEIKSCQEEGDGFLVKVNSSGELLYSTCFGGSDAEGGKDIIVAEKDIVYISGTTSSNDFSGINGNHGGNRDGYVIKLDIAKNSINGTYLGGSGDDCRMSGSCAMARDNAGYIYITGDTTSNNFLTGQPLCIDSSCSAYDGSKYHGGGGAIWDGNWGGDIFVTKLSPNLSTTVYSTYLGGSGYEESYGIAVDDDGNVYVAGSTDSKDFPLKGTLKSAGSELSNSNSNITRNDDAFLTRLSWDNSSSKLDLDFSTLLGGSKSDLAANEVAVLDDQNIYVAGRTHSDDFFDGFFNEQNQPLGSNAFSNTFKGDEEKYDGFLTKLKWNETTEKLRMEFGAYLGGSDNDGIGGIVLDDKGHLYLTGSTRSSNFPKNRQLGTRGERDGFIIKATPTIACIPPPDDMVAWYPFDETSGNIAHDIIGENDGTVNDGAERITGKIGGGLKNSSVNIPDKDELDIRSGNDFSTDFWFQWNRNTGVILDKSSGSSYDSTDGYEIFIIYPWCMVDDATCPRYVEVAINDNFLNDDISCKPPNSPYSDTPWNWISPFWESEWIHLALTIDNESSKSTVALYLNGEKCNSKVYASEMDAPTNLDLVQSLFKVDELKFFNRTLSPTDVRSIYETGRDNISYCKVDFQGDTDNDGVLTSEENLAPNSGDGNGDGILDSQQNNVTSLPNAENGNYLTLQVEPANCKLANVEVKTEALLTIDPYYDYPYGLIEFEAQCENAEVTVFYHGATSLPSEYRKYGPETPGSGTNEWYRLRNDADFFNNVTFTSVNIGNKSVPAITFDLANNERGDDTDANDGKIVDIGGIANSIEFHSLSVNPTSKDIPATSGTFTFDVANTGNGIMNWAATSDASWLTIESGDYGENSGTITVSYDANPGVARTATIKVEANAGNSPQTVEVKQAMKPIDNGLALDMDISTTDYESTDPDSEIESQISACKEDEIWIAVAALGVTNLDTYQVEASFDTDKLEFLEGAEENPMGGINNLLKKNGGTTTGFLAVENTPGTVNISDTLTGTDCNQAPEGSGALALLKFRVLDGDPDAALTLGNVFFLDCTGGNEEITDLRNGKITMLQPMECDFNLDGIVDFMDLGLLANHWLFKCGDGDWDTKYDLNGDCITNFLDLQVFGDLWLKESPCFDE